MNFNRGLKYVCIIGFCFMIMFTFWSFCIAIYSVTHSEFDQDDEDEIIAGSLNEFENIMGRRHSRPMMLYAGSRYAKAEKTKPYGDTVDLDNEQKEKVKKYNIFQPESDSPANTLASPSNVESSFAGGIRSPVAHHDSITELKDKQKKTDTLLSIAESYKKKCSEGKRGVKFNEFYHVDFRISEKNVCDIRDVHVLIFVHSQTSNFKRRMRIRSTFGSLNMIDNRAVRIIFSLGSTLNNNIQKQIVAESRAYRDVIQGNFQENIRNLSMNQNLAFRWIIDHCPNAQFVVKLDDDTFLDVMHLNFLLGHVPRTDLLYCSIAYNRRPDRQKQSKWYVSRRHFSDGKFPPFCLGLGYVMSVDMAVKLLGCSMAVRTIPVNDVFYTGIVAEEAGVSHNAFWNGHSYIWLTPRAALPMLMSDYIFFPSKNNIVEDGLWGKLWRSALMNAA